MTESPFQKIAHNTYRRWDPVLQKRVTVTFEGTGERKLMHVKIEQPKQLIQDILDMNVEQQNSFAGYGNAEGFQAFRMSPQVYQQIMEKCGHQPGKGYDEKKFKSILNDRDYYKLKTIPGRV